jgi:hypothetical protein
MTSETKLRYAALLYALGLALHTADHFRRGLDAVTGQVLWGGNFSTLIGVVTVVLVLLGNRHGPMAAAITGIPVAVGVAAVHLLPEWSAFSDAFVGAENSGVNALSWTVVLIEITGAALMGATGISIVRSQNRLDGTARPSVPNAPNG